MKRGLDVLDSSLIICNITGECSEDFGFADFKLSTTTKTKKSIEPQKFRLLSDTRRMVEFCI